MSNENKETKRIVYLEKQKLDDGKWWCKRALKCNGGLEDRRVIE